MSKFEGDRNDMKSLTRDIIIPNIINEYHYSFFSSKNYKVPICLRVINMVLLALALGGIYLTLHLVSINLFYIGFIIFIIIGVLWLINSLYIQYIVNAKIVLKFHMLLGDDDLKSFINELKEFNKNRKLEIKNFTIKDIGKTVNIKLALVSILKFKNKVYVESIVDTWLSKIVRKEKQLEFADKISDWKDLQDKYNSGNKFNINNFVFSHDSKARITGLIAVLFSVLAVIIIKNGDVNIFYELFSREGLKLLLIIALLVIESLFLTYMTISVTKELLDFIDDYFNDKFELDKKPSDLRVNRFIGRLLLKNSIETEIQCIKIIK